MAGNYFTTGDKQKRIELTLQKSFLCHAVQNYLLAYLVFCQLFLLLVLLFMVFSMFPTFFEWENMTRRLRKCSVPLLQSLFLVFGMGILSIGLLIFFIMHLLRHKALDSTERIIWILVFLFAGIIGYPIYWYMRVWKDDI